MVRMDRRGAKTIREVEIISGVFVVVGEYISSIIVCYIIHSHFPVRSSSPTAISTSTRSSTDCRSTVAEAPPNTSSVESYKTNPPDHLISSLLDKDKELKRLFHEKQVLLSRLLNLSSAASIHTMKPSSSVEAITTATNYRTYFMASRALKHRFPFRQSNHGNDQSSLE